MNQMAKEMMSGFGMSRFLVSNLNPLFKVTLSRTILSSLELALETSIK
jgi:hypothetical protein